MHCAHSIEFSSLPNCWTPVTTVKALDKKSILAVQLDGVPLVFFRNGAGEVCALVDRCPHRSVQLSGGNVTQDGHIQCPFHGWQYDGEGNCTYIALNPNVSPKSVKAWALPCQEAGGLLWVFTQVDAEDVPPLHVPEALTESGWYGTITEQEWGTHWSRATQTMLDISHIPFVHANTIGLALGRAIGRSQNPQLDTRMIQGIDGSFRMDWKMQGDQNDGDSGWLKFFPPNGLVLPLPTKSKDQQSLIHLWCVPIDERRTHIIAVSRRNFGRFNVVSWLLNRLNPLILSEDRRIIKTASPAEVPPLGVEVSVPSDASTIAFNRYYQKHFRSQNSQSDSEVAISAKRNSEGTAVKQ